MIHIDLFYLALGVVLACAASAGLGAWIWGRAVKRDALADKEWILKNTIFKDRFLIELRALEVEARGFQALNLLTGNYLECRYWSGKLQAFQDVIVKLGGKIYV